MFQDKDTTSWNQKLAPCCRWLVEGRLPPALPEVSTGEREAILRIAGEHLHRTEWAEGTQAYFLKRAAASLGVTLDTAPSVAGSYPGCSDATWAKWFCPGQRGCPLVGLPLNMEQVYDRYFFSSHTKAGLTFSAKKLAAAILQRTPMLAYGGRLYVYKNGFYAPEGREHVLRMAREHLLHEYRDARAMETVKYLMSACRVDDYDPNVFSEFINVENGWLAWRAGKLLAHSSGHLSITRIPIRYDPAARCPAIDAFLHSTFTEDVIPLVEEMIGWLMIPDTRFEKAFMLHGSGRNGKSTLLKLLEAFLGPDNVSKIPLQEIAENRFKRAELAGKLANTFSDLNSRALRDTSYFKAIVSGDAIDAERKFGDPFSFVPRARLVFSSNDIPRSYDPSDAYFRRWMMIPFPFTFGERQADRYLIDKLTTPFELSGLLNRALTGLRRLFQQGGFTQPASSQELLNQYRLSCDTLEAFIEECCDVGVGHECGKTAFYQAYARWCREQGLYPQRREHVNKQLAGRWQVRESKPKGGPRRWRGVSLVANGWEGEA